MWGLLIDSSLYSEAMTIYMDSRGMNMTGEVMNEIGNNMIGPLVISFISLIHTHTRACARVSIDTNGNIAWIN